MSQELEIRPARIEEREEALRCANVSFGGRSSPSDFLTSYPHVWTDERMCNTWLGLKNGEIVALAGVYPFTVRMAGTEFRTAGIGQVATLPEFRGQGCMSSILKVVTAELDAGQCDFAWLGGERHRYGRFGWARGGLTYAFTLSGKNLPDTPNAGEVRTMDLDKDIERIERYVQQEQYTVGFSREEMQMLLSSPETSAVVCGDAWVGYETRGGSPIVLIADGGEEAIAAILSHLAAQSQAAEEGDGQVRLHLAPCDSALMRIAMRYYSTMNLACPTSFRICDLVGYFRKAAGIVEPALSGGSDELSLRNTDNAQEVRIVCKGGKFSVEPQAGANAREMTTLEISEAIFSPLPLDTTLPDLPTDSPIRALLSVPAHIDHFFRI